MSNVINLADIKRMQEALDEADIKDPKVMVYRDIYGIPQIAVEGECITQQQYNNMPDEILALIKTEEI